MLSKNNSTSVECSSHPKSDANLVVDKIKDNGEYLIEKDFFVNRVTPEDSDPWLQMGRLRAEVYVHDNAFLSAEVLDEDGAEFDEYDNDADHFVALNDKQRVVGTIRIIHRPKNDKLPCEEIFGVDMSNGSREVSRIMVDPRVPRKLQSMVTMSLLRAAIKAAPKNEDEAYAIIEPSMFRYLNDIVGVKLQVVAESRFIEQYNSINMVVSMRPHEMTSQIHKRDKFKRLPLGFPENLATFFEYNSTKAGLGRVALNAFDNPSPEQFDRNLGFINQAEHELLQSSTVSIAGTGGDGGELAVVLAQLGVGRFRLADPEVFEVNNLNRQAGASFNTIGRNKAVVISEIIKDINPCAEVVLFTEGVTQENVNDFIKGSNLVIDETEFTHHELGVMIARAARSYNLPVLMTLNIGFGSYTTSFDPSGKTFESYLGLSQSASLEEIAQESVQLSRWVPHIPSYSDINNFKKVALGEVPTPSVSTGVKIGVAEASTQALAHLLKSISPQREKWIYYAPHGKSIDLVDGIERVRYPRMHYYKTIAIAALRTKLGKNPPAGY